MITLLAVVCLHVRQPMKATLHYTCDTGMVGPHMKQQLLDFSCRLLTGDVPGLQHHQ